MESNKIKQYKSAALSARNYNLETHEKESMFRTFGASGIFIKSELLKKEMRLLASRLVGTSIADSLTVRSKYSLLIWISKTNNNYLIYRLDSVILTIVPSLTKHLMVDTET